MTRDSWVDGLRGDPAFAAVMRRAEERHRDAVIAFLQAGGAQVLGVYEDGGVAATNRQSHPQNSRSGRPGGHAA